MLLRVLISTYRIKFTETSYQNKKDANGTFVFALWHGNLLPYMAAHAWSGPYLAMASKSKDGDIAAYIAHKLGFVPVRGSSRKGNKDKGGKEAAEIYIQKLNQGFNGAITVDGPRGPRHQCKMGIIKIAQLSRRPIIPATAQAKHCWTFNSWDKFKFPKPFTEITVHYAKPVWVDFNATESELLQAQEEINRELIHLESWPN